MKNYMTLMINFNDYDNTMLNLSIHLSEFKNKYNITPCIFCSEKFLNWASKEAEERIPGIAKKINKPKFNEFGGMIACFEGYPIKISSYLPDNIINIKGEEEMKKEKFSNIKKLAEGYEEEIPDNVNHPAHYCREGGMECIDEMILLFGIEEVLSFCKLNAYKYRYRAADKNGTEDLAKSDWYLNKYKELKEKEYKD